MPLSARNNTILLVDNEEGICFTLGRLLTKEGYLVETASGVTEALKLISCCCYDLAFFDINLDDGSGMDLLREAKMSCPGMQVIIFTGSPQVSSAIEAVRLGAFDYITKPIRFETLIAVTRHAIKSKMLFDERESYRSNLDAIFRSVNDSIIMVDDIGRLVEYNCSAENSCGYKRGDIGTNAADIATGCGGACRTLLFKALGEGTKKELRRIECHTPGGTTRIVTVTATPVSSPDGRINGAVAVIRDESEIASLERSLLQRGRFHGFIGISEPMQRAYSLIESLADLPTTVLITGESGTGKELAAAALHYSGSRAGKPFVKVNCSALSEHLLESELFGHVRGSFTGAIADKTGRFQKAEGGTLFLDEIGDISPAVQMRLLRFLQDGEFERVGESNTIKSDVRIITATNQNIAEKVRQGVFRQDLLFRLNVVRVVLPPLRERPGDLELLVPHFVSHYNNRLSRRVEAVSDDVMKLFRSWSWPGNVRELEHVIEHAVILCRHSTITLDDLPLDLLDNSVGRAEITPPPPAERAATQGGIADALLKCNGNKAKAAKMMGISRMTLYRHLDGQKVHLPD